MAVAESVFEEISSLLKGDISTYQEVYLVGGAVRDFLLGKENLDLDFAMPQESIRAARKVADFFNGGFFVLDKERETARAIINLQGKTKHIDFAKFNGNTIHEDLINRDFTMNAMAIDIQNPQEIIDPLMGKKHLSQKLLYPCRKEAFILDPVRTLRAVRFLGTLDFKLGEGVRELIIRAAENLSQVSNERIRDELFHIFVETQSHASLRTMMQLNIFEQVFPELIGLSEIYPGKPHQYHVLDHSLKVVEMVQKMIEILSGEKNECSNLLINQMVAELDHWRDELVEFFNHPLHPDRGYKELLVLSALFHDSGKLVTEPVEVDGMIKFPGHASRSAQIVQAWAKRMALSNLEIDYVDRTIAHHMKKELKSISEPGDHREEIYQFYKEAGKAGVTVGFIHLADLIATYGPAIQEARWRTGVESVKILLDSWFFHKDEIIDPPKLINGDDLMHSLGIEAGKRVGELLEEIRLAQVMGMVKNKEMALEYVLQKMERG